METFTLIKQGAEAKLYKGQYLGKSAIAKERFIKKYRHPTLDSFLTKERIKAESRAIVRCKTCGIKTPTLYFVDFNRHIIFMEYFEQSITVKEFIYKADNDNIINLSYKIGLILGTMHKNNIIHGDLTTSNLILVNKNGKEQYDDLTNLEIVLIDFGLAHVESSTEDKGVDLYVLERAITSTHSQNDIIFSNIIKGYQVNNKSGFKEVFAKYEEVRARGRKRTMVG